MPAKVTYVHPELGTTTTTLTEYKTQANGTLVAMTTDGFQLLLPAAGEWVVTDPMD